MPKTDEGKHREILKSIARQAMLERGLLPDFSDQALTELDGIHDAAAGSAEPMRDLRNLTWCSIDNDDSLRPGPAYHCRSHARRDG